VHRLGDAGELDAGDLEQLVRRPAPLARQRVLAAEQLHDDRVVAQQLREGAGPRGRRAIVPGHERGLATDAGQRLEREDGALEPGPQPVGDLDDRRGRQRGGADDGERRQVDDERAVGADREPAMAGDLGDRRQPARRAAGDEDDVHAGALARVEGGESARRDGAVGADDRAVEVTGHHAHGLSVPGGPAGPERRVG
jgi:hypothetical protein